MNEFTFKFASATNEDVILLYETLVSFLNNRCLVPCPECKTQNMCKQICDLLLNLRIEINRRNIEYDFSE